jgi:hypothetical protein
MHFDRKGSFRARLSAIYVVAVLLSACSGPPPDQPAGGQPKSRDAVLISEEEIFSAFVGVAVHDWQSDDFSICGEESIACRGGCSCVF